MSCSWSGGQIGDQTAREIQPGGGRPVRAEMRCAGVDPVDEDSQLLSHLWPAARGNGGAHLDQPPGQLGTVVPRLDAGGVMGVLELDAGVVERTAAEAVAAHVGLNGVEHLTEGAGGITTGGPGVDLGEDL